MIDRSKAVSSNAARACVRLAIALCLVVFGLGDAVERSLAGHVTLDAALSYAVLDDRSAVVSGDHSGVHVDAPSGGSESGAKPVGHGCHGCAALPEPMLRLAVAPAARGSVLAWASAPSAAGHKPLVDLRPPRA